MEIKFKDKPNDVLIDDYCKRLERLLSSYKTSIKVNLYDRPVLHRFLENNIESLEYWWIQNFSIKCSLGSCEIVIPRFGLEKKLSDDEIWHDALCMQSEIYHELKIDLPKKIDSNPYWLLYNPEMISLQKLN